MLASISNHTFTTSPKQVDVLKQCLEEYREYYTHCVEYVQDSNLKIQMLDFDTIIISNNLEEDFGMIEMDILNKISEVEEEYWNFLYGYIEEFEIEGKCPCGYTILLGKNKCEAGRKHLCERIDKPRDFSIYWSLDDLIRYSPYIYV